MRRPTLRIQTGPSGKSCPASAGWRGSCQGGRISLFTNRLAVRMADLLGLEHLRAGWRQSRADVSGRIEAADTSGRAEALTLRTLRKTRYIPRMSEVLDMAAIAALVG